MAIREDFRNALGSIAAAIPEAVRTMRHGETEQGAVVQSSSRDFAEAIQDKQPKVAARYVANAADFPTLDEGEAVDLDGSVRIVVTLKQDPVAATLTAGLSNAFRPAAYSVTRRVDGALRTQSFPVMVLIDDNGGTVEDVTLAGLGKVYKLFVIQKEWPEPTPPHAGAWFTLFDGTRLAVQKVERKMPNGFLIYATDDVTPARR